MYNYAEVWLRLFATILNGLIASGAEFPHNAATTARAWTDEAMVHLHPSILYVPKPVPIEASLAEDLAYERGRADALLDAAGHDATVTTESETVKAPEPDPA
jgi:hypothetical protein